MLRSNALVALFLVAPLAVAAQPVPQRDVALWGLEAFVGAHPDVKYRKQGLWQMEQGHPERAMAEFLRAAKFADKGSQGMLAEMYWQGQHVAQDRPRAYAWMDLAAERGYVLFVGKREHYWNQLTPAERAQALQVGTELYATYGDDVARPRLQHVLVRELRKTTGSHIGALGAVTVVPVAGNVFGSKKDIGKMGLTIGGDTYYNRKYWIPERYFAWTDAVWNEMPQGGVEVGDIQATKR